MFLAFRAQGLGFRALNMEPEKVSLIDYCAVNGRLYGAPCKWWSP